MIYSKHIKFVLLSLIILSQFSMLAVAAPIKNIYISPFKNVSVKEDEFIQIETMFINNIKRNKSFNILDNIVIIEKDQINWDSSEKDIYTFGNKHNIDFLISGVIIKLENQYILRYKVFNIKNKCIHCTGEVVTVDVLNFKFLLKVIDRKIKAGKNYRKISYLKDQPKIYLNKRSYFDIKLSWDINGTLIFSNNFYSDSADIDNDLTASMEYNHLINKNISIGLGFSIEDKRVDDTGDGFYFNSIYVPVKFHTISRIPTYVTVHYGYNIMKMDIDDPYDYFYFKNGEYVAFGLGIEIKDRIYLEILKVSNNGYMILNIEPEYLTGDDRYKITYSFIQLNLLLIL